MKRLLSFVLFTMLLFVVSSDLNSQNQWNIRLSQSNLDCTNSQVCYHIELENNTPVDWTLGDQNYRFFFDGDVMTVASATSLLPSTNYGNATIDQNVKISGQGQEAVSPLDDIDDNLGFLDFSITQTNKSNPANGVILTQGTFTPVAEICIDVIDVTNNDCLTFYHSRPMTAGGITSQYTTISENNLPNTTIPTLGVGFDDLTPADGLASCFDAACITNNEWDIELSQNSINCDTRQICYHLSLQSDAATWTLSDQNYRLFFDGDLMTVQSVTSLLPATFYNGANVTQNMKISGQGQEAASPLDDIDDNLGFLEFDIVQFNKSNPTGATQLNSTIFTPVAEICIEATPEAMDDLTLTKCLKMYHSRPSTAGTITNQYTAISENDIPNNTVSTTGRTYFDFIPANNSDACLGPQCGCDAAGQMLSK